MSDDDARAVPLGDELDLLRAFRPEVAGPTDALMSDERNALMDTITAEPAAGPGPAHPTRRRPRKRRLVVAVAVAVAAIGGVAGAAGLIPDDVQRTLGLTGDHDPTLAAKVDEAVKRVSAAAPGGGTVEVWTAPTTGGGTCAYLRHLAADGTPRDPGGVGCQNPARDGKVTGEVTGAGRDGGAALTMMAEGPDGPMSVQMEWGADDPLTVYGHVAPGAARVVVTREDGSTVTAPVTEDGWYVLALAPGTDPGALRTLEVVSSTGTALAQVPLGGPPPGAHTRP
ncbi:MAG: hypothetical protein AB1416_13485 [Actinomycetota bacterium]